MRRRRQWYAQAFSSHPRKLFPNHDRLPTHRGTKPAHRHGPTLTKERIIPVAAEADRTSVFPTEVFQAAWETGLVNATIPSDYGGLGLGELENTMITEELGYGCTGIQTSVTANTLAATPLLLAGNEDQKKKYLGALTSAPNFASYATSEPGAGSDVAGMSCKFEKHGDDFVLNGAKAWITNASRSSWFVVFATSDPATRHRGIAAFLIDRDTPGFRVGKHEDKLGQRASDTCTLHLEDVVVPKANLLAGEGAGFKLAMETFNQTRPDIGAAAVGLMRRCLDESVAYAKERKTFGVPIAQHQMVQAMIAEGHLTLEASCTTRIRGMPLMTKKSLSPITRSRRAHGTCFAESRQVSAALCPEDS